MRDGPRRFPQNSSCSAVLRCRLAAQTSFRVRASHPLRTNFPDGSATLSVTARRRSYNPGRGFATAPVWAPARSLATTCAIILIFSSSGYLDVSVPRVRPPESAPVWRDRSRRVSPFGHPRVAGHLPLTAAFRSLSRPSSPPRATGIPHAPLFAFLSPFKARDTPPPGTIREGPRGLALLDLYRVTFRSIALLQLDFSLRCSETASCDAAGQKPRRLQDTLLLSSLYSSRSQHVNDLIVSLRSPRQT